MKRYFPIVPKRNAFKASVSVKGLNPNRGSEPSTSYEVALNCTSPETTIVSTNISNVSQSCESSALRSESEQQDIGNLSNSRFSNSVVCTESESSNSDKSQDAMASPVNKKKYSQKYKCEWEMEFAWLRKVDGRAFCSICFTMLTNNKSHLSRHLTTKLHIKNIKTRNTTPNIEQYCHNSIKLSNINKKRESEFMCVMYCIQYDLPFVQMDSLPALLKMVCSDSNIVKQLKCGRTKATAMVNTIIGPFAKQLIAGKLKETKFSLIIDETTDVSTAKCLVIVARFYDKSKCTISDSFMGLIELTDSTAKEIFNIINHHFEQCQIPIKNVISLGVDNASVMTGHANGVVSKFLEINPDLFFLRCTCHSLHLCASAASKKLPGNIEKTIKNIYNHFSHSPKRIGAYRQFQEYFNLANHKILGLSTTRWLSYEMVVNRILEQWEALTYYFGLHNYEELHSSNAGDIYNFLIDPVSKMYLLFLSYVLKLVNDANKIFQSENTQIHILYFKMKQLFLELLKNFIKLEFVNTETDFKNVSLYLSPTFMHFGIQIHQFLNTQQFDQEKISSLKLSLSSFYVELCDQIKKRFNFQNSKLELLKYLNINEIISGDLPTIVPILKFFPFHECDEEILNNQFRKLIGNTEIAKQFIDNDIVAFWIKLKLFKNALGEYEYQDICNYMLRLCALPHSTAAAERKFSRLNLIKTALRNNLNTLTVENLLYSKELLNISKSCWVPSDSEDLFKFADKFVFVDGEYKLK